MLATKKEKKRKRNINFIRARRTHHGKEERDRERGILGLECCFDLAKCMISLVRSPPLTEKTSKQLKKMFVNALIRRVYYKSIHQNKVKRRKIYLIEEPVPTVHSRAMIKTLPTYH